MQTDEKGPGRDLALYHQGRVLAVLDRKTEALEMFQKALAVPETPLKIELESRIASLGGTKPSAKTDDPKIEPSPEPDK